MTHRYALPVWALAACIAPCQSTLLVPGAHPTIQAAIQAAQPGDQILVLPGVYMENLDFLGKRLVVESVAGPASTTIDGSNGNTAVVIVSNSEPAGTAIKGFTIRGGKGRPFPSSYGFDYYGGGIFVGAANTRLRVEDCWLVDNALATGTFGGGIHAGGQNVRVELYGCLIRNNRAWASGGASLCEGQGAVMLFERCTVTGNSATSWAFGHQGGISVANYGSAVVKDCIVWGNAGYQMRAFGFPYNVGTSIACTYSTVQGGFAGSGNLSADPQWTNAQALDFTLQANSPCIDSGDPTSSPDADGTRADQGAFAFDQGPPGWVDLQLAGGPSARNSAAMAFDLARSESVLFGGFDGTQMPLGDTWTLRGSAWTQRTLAVAPPARWGHGMVHDARRQRTVIFGGWSATSQTWLNDLWEWDGSAWSQVAAASGPSPRGYFGMAYDSLRGRAFVFGGIGAGGAYLGDLWSWDGGAWRPESNAGGPGPRRGAALGWDRERELLVLFGGGDATVVHGDTWTFDGSAWLGPLPGSGPQPRWEARMIEDPSCGQLLLTGGADRSYATDFGDSWQWDGAAWIPTQGAAPSPRHGAAISFDPDQGKAIVFGGRSTSGFRADVWQLETPCGRSSEVLAAPRLGQVSAFRSLHPASAAGNIGWQVLTPHFPAAVPIALPGLVGVGQTRVDLVQVLTKELHLLDASGAWDVSVAIPANSAFLGYAFDVQSVDLDPYTGWLWWSRSDAEVSIGL